jgi:hypothetical protein
MIGTLDPASQGYVGAVRRTLLEALGSQLAACYVYGSALTPEFLPGRSDLDVLVLTRTWMPGATEQVVTERLRALPRPAALKGLDIWFLPLAVSRNPGDTPAYQLQMLTWLDSSRCGATARRGDPRLAMLLAICRNHAAVLEGPAPATVIGRVPLAGILSGMLVDLSRHPYAHYRVLNACRDQHFLEEGRMCSKLEGVRWARGRRAAPPDLLDAAVEWQVRGTGPALDVVEVDALVTGVAQRLRDGIHFGELPAACRRWTQLDATPADGPKVTAMMPTCDRRPFVEQSIRLFMAQDYPNRELVIVDDGADEVSDLVPAGAPVRYLRMRRPSTIGEKRNVCARASDGDIIVQWDDDDWYGPARLSRQVGPLVAGRADLTAIQKSWVADLDEGRFYRRRLRAQGMAESIAAGTIAMTSDLWRRSGQYPDASHREDVTIYRRARSLGARIESVANDGLYVYGRHGGNSWRFPRAPSDDPWWSESPPPAFISEGELARYLSLRDSRAVHDLVDAAATPGRSPDRPAASR